MAVYHLRPDGDDGDDGTTHAAAWRTFGRAAGRSWLPGDRLHVVPGTYAETGLAEFVGGGDPSAPVVIASLDPAAVVVADFGSSRLGSVKFNVAGVGFDVYDIRVTQASWTPNTPGDRQLAAQLSQDENHAPADVRFIRCHSYNAYEPLKASGVVQRIRFLGCVAHTCQIAAGIAGAADDCSIEGCTLYGFSDDGVQAKGGCRDALIARNIVAMPAGSNTGISLGGSSVINDMSPAWWRDDGYEASHALAVANLVVLAAGGADDYPALIRFSGAKNARSANNTLIQLDAFAAGYATAYQVNRSGGGGWSAGNPYSADLTIENDIVVGVDQLITTNNGHHPTGANVLRNLTLQGVYDNLGDEGYDVGSKGPWTLGARAVRNPQLVAANLAGTWQAIDARLQTGSPERGAGVAVVHPDFAGGSAMTLAARRDFFGRQAGTGARDRGCSEDTVHRRRRTFVVG